MSAVDNWMLSSCDSTFNAAMSAASTAFVRGSAAMRRLYRIVPRLLFRARLSVVSISQGKIEPCTRVTVRRFRHNSKNTAAVMSSASCASSTKLNPRR